MLVLGWAGTQDFVRATESHQSPTLPSAAIEAGSLHDVPGQETVVTYTHLLSFLTEKQNNPCDGRVLLLREGVAAWL